MGQYPKMGKNRQDIPQHIPSAYALLSIFDKGRGIIVWFFFGVFLAISPAVLYLRSRFILV